MISTALERGGAAQSLPAGPALCQGSIYLDTRPILEQSIFSKGRNPGRDDRGLSRECSMSAAPDIRKPMMRGVGLFRHGDHPWLAELAQVSATGDFGRLEHFKAQPFFADHGRPAEGDGGREVARFRSPAAALQRRARWPGLRVGQRFAHDLGCCCPVTKEISYFGHDPASTASSLSQPKGLQARFFPPLHSVTRKTH
jgi:hypothetical protein